MFSVLAAVLLLMMAVAAFSDHGKAGVGVATLLGGSVAIYFGFRLLTDKESA